MVSVNCDNIHDWPSLHEVFAHVFGFPDFYGRIMDAWIDCMESLDKPEDGMSRIHCNLGTVLTLVKDVRRIRERCREQYDAIIECSAFVNWSRIEVGEATVLALSFYS